MGAPSCLTVKIPEGQRLIFRKTLKIPKIAKR